MSDQFHQILQTKSFPLLSDGIYYLFIQNSPLDIVVKEINIQQSLKDSTKVNHKMMLIKRLVVTPVNPIQDIQSSVGTHEENIVTSQVLNFSVPLQNNQLWKDGNTFEVD